MLKRYVLILGLLMISLFCFAQDSVLNNVNKIIDKASLLIQQQNVDSAEIFMVENKDIFMDSEYNLFLYNNMMGKIYMIMSNFDAAQTYYGEASKLVDKDVDYYIAEKDSCALGIYYYYGVSFIFSDFDKALQLYNKTKKYYELASLENTWLYQFLTSYLKLYETDSVETISIQSEIDSASYHIFLAEFDEAISILTPLLKMKNIDIESMGYVYYFLGDAYWKSNNYRMAENVFNEGLNDVIYKMRKEPLIERLYYTELGSFYNSLGNYTMALDYLAYAQELYEKNNDFGIGYVLCLYNIAGTMINQQDIFYHLSSKMWIDIAIDYALKLPNAIEVDIILSRLYLLSSVLYNNIGLNDLSINYLKKSMKIDVDIPDIKASQYSIIAIDNMRRGAYDTAQYYAYKAYQISKLNSSLEQKDYRLIYVLSQYLNNDIDYVANVSKLMVELQEDVIQNFLFLSRTQRREYWYKMLRYIYELNTFLYSANDVQLYGELYNQLLFAKGMLLRTSNFINLNVRNIEDKTRITQLRQYQDTLSLENMINEYIVALVQNEVSRQEKDLMQENIGYMDFKRNLLYDWNKIRKSLKRDEKSIEFIQLWGFNKESLLFDTVKYAAIVVDSKSKYPQIIPLCTDDTLRSIFDRDITTISTSGKKSQLNRYVTNIYSTKNPRFMNGEELYSLVWEPLEEAIGDAKTIYYSTSGLLNSVSFAAISHENVSLCDRYNMVYLSSTAEVPNQKKRKKMKMKDAIVYGGISYSTPKEEMVMASQKYQDSVSSTMMVARGENRGALVDLEGTYKEAMCINEYLNTKHISSKIMSGSQANEESFKALDGKSPSLIHLATHGFFMSDLKTVVMSPFMQSHRVEITTMDNALERAGLCFSGANYAWMGDSIDANIEDGILTAEELSYMDLSNTELVVLSACETGLGESMVSEGIFGLQRAFKLAGVKSLVMSLWKVDDKATAEFMRLFYEKWLSGTPRREAFNEAQREMKQMKGYESPYYWAGFVMMD